MPLAPRQAHISFISLSGHLISDLLRDSQVVPKPIGALWSTMDDGSWRCPDRALHFSQVMVVSSACNAQLCSMMVSQLSLALMVA